MSGERSPSERDRDRVLESSAFRRLAEVTQVVSPTEGHVFHSRLTHTIEVAQIGRRLAERLLEVADEAILREAGGLAPDVVEAACLAHDLGHPPFGHVAEYELQQAVKETGNLPPGSFEGNAQSFRIVTRLAILTRPSEDPDLAFLGLNLTRATLNAVLKYPWSREETGFRSRKWCVYEKDADQGIFDNVRTGIFDMSVRRTLEAEIMDWADDVAYSVHDLEDFYRAGLIPLDALCRPGDPTADKFLQEMRQDYDNSKDDGDAPALPSMDDIELAFDKLRARIRETFLIEEPYNGSREHRGLLRTLTSTLSDLFISAVTVRSERDPRDGWLQKDPKQHAQMLALKGLTKHLVIDRPGLGTLQHGLRRIVRRLFDEYELASRDDKLWRIFPKLYRDELQRIWNEERNRDSARIRMVIDLISSLSEREAVNRYRLITGQTTGSVMDRF